MGNRCHLFGRLTGKLAIRDVPVAVNDRKPLAARHIHRNAKRPMTFQAPRGARHGARLVDHARHDHERLKIIKKARPDLVHIGANLAAGVSSVPVVDPAAPATPHTAANTPRASIVSSLIALLLGIAKVAP